MRLTLQGVALMSDQFQTGPFNARLADLTLPPTPLPVWIARRLLQPNERVTQVYGPKWNPSWEQYVTHPALFLAALALGAIWVWIGLRTGTVVEMSLIAGGIVLASVFVLGIFCGYFTRLVATNRRLIIIQGYEVCRSWHLDRLPRSMLRFTTTADGLESSEVDLNAVQTLLGSSSNQVADAQTILRFGKSLDHITRRDRGGS
jgi:hypothetical protein